MTDLAPARVFIASPSDGKAERKQIKEAIERYNESQRRPEQREYVLVGWERTRGTARRPQDEINDLISSCTFMIVVFKQSWGSAPGSFLGYTSGTEEELFNGLLQLADPDRLMEDLWVVFIDNPAPSVEVQDLRTQMEQNHALMYDLITNPLELDRKLNERLGDWQENAGNKTARRLNLVPRSGRDVLRAANLRLHGEALFRLGFPDEGLIKLEEAVKAGGPIERLAYSRVLSRQGRFDDALHQIRTATTELLSDGVEVSSSLLSQAVLAEAAVLRRKGGGPEAIARLSAALGELDRRAADSWRTQAEILDLRGLVYADAKRIDDARADFTRSLQLRISHGASVLMAQALVNLVRLESGERNFVKADLHATEMLQQLGSSTPSAVHANVWTAVAQLRLRQGRGVDGVLYAEQALALNRQMANRTGEAKSLLVLAQCYRSAKDYKATRRFAEECRALNETMRNIDGVQRAQWLLNQLPAE